MPLFDLNQMTAIADGLKGQLERRQLSKETGDKKRKLNHSLQEADRLVNKQAAQQERAARIEASGQETALRVDTIKKSTGINVQAARASTALSNAQRSAQTAANVSHNQAARAVENQAARGQHQIQQARAIGDHMAGKQLANVARQHQHASQWNSRNQGKALAESGIQHAAERTQSSNEQAIERWQERDELKQADINAKLKSGSESMGKQLGQFAVQAFNSYTAGQQRAASRAFDTGRAQMQQAMAGMDSAQRQEYIQSGQWKQHFTDYEAKVEAIKHPFVRREAAAKMEAAMTQIQAGTTAQNIQMQSKQNAVDWQKATSEGESSVAQDGPVASAGARQQIVEELTEINERMPEGSRASKADIQEAASAAVLKGEYKHAVGKKDTKAMRAILDSDAATKVLSADQIKQGRLTADRYDRQDVLQDRSDIRWEESRKAKEEAAKKRLHNDEVKHIENITDNKDWVNSDNDVMLDGYSEKFKDRMRKFRAYAQELSDKGVGLDGTANQMDKEEAIKRGILEKDPKTRDAVIKNQKLMAAMKEFDKQGRQDPQSLDENLNGDSQLNAVERNVKYGKHETNRMLSTIGGAANQAVESGNVDTFLDKLAGRYDGNAAVAQSVLEDSLDHSVNEKGIGVSERKRRLENRAIILQAANPRYKNYVNERNALAARKQNGGSLEDKYKHIVPANTDDFRDVPQFEKSAIYDLWRHQAQAKVNQTDWSKHKGTTAALNTAKRKLAQDTLNKLASGPGDTERRRDKVETKLSTLMMDGKTPYISENDRKEVGTAQIAESTISLRAELNDFENRYNKYLSEETKDVYRQLRSRGEGYTTGFRQSEDTAKRWEVWIQPDSSPAVRVKLQGGKEPSVDRADALRHGVVFPGLEAPVKRDFLEVGVHNAMEKVQTTGMDSAQTRKEKVAAALGAHVPTPQEEEESLIRDLTVDEAKRVI